MQVSLLLKRYWRAKATCTARVTTSLRTWTSLKTIDQRWFTVHADVQGLVAYLQVSADCQIQYALQPLAPLSRRLATTTTTPFRYVRTHVDHVSRCRLLKLRPPGGVIVPRVLVGCFRHAKPLNIR